MNRNKVAGVAIIPIIFIAFLGLTAQKAVKPPSELPLLESTKARAAATITPVVLVTSVQVAQTSPVIYTNNNGGGPGEYQASNNPNVPNEYPITFPVPPGAHIVAAWWTPYHNVKDVTGFALINVKTTTPTSVTLQVGSFGANARLRITIYALIVK